MRFSSVLKKNGLINALCVAAFIFSLSNSVYSRDLDGDGVSDEIASHVDKNNSLIVGFKSSGSDKNVNHVFKAFDECSQMGVYSTGKVGEVAVDGSCQSRGGQIYIWLLRLDIMKPRWCVERIVSGEKSDPLSDTPIPKYYVQRLSKCQLYENENSKIDEKNLAGDAFYEDWIDGLSSSLLISDERNKVISVFSEFDASEIATRIDGSNVEVINNLGYYLQLKNKDVAAAILFDEVINHYPERVVAKLNLADSYWKMGFKEASLRFYKAYFEQMNSLGRAKKIPKRVIERMKYVIS